MIPRSLIYYTSYIPRRRGRGIANFVRRSEDSAKMTGSVLALTTRGCLPPPRAALCGAATRRSAPPRVRRCAPHKMCPTRKTSRGRRLFGDGCMCAGMRIPRAYLAHTACAYHVIDQLRGWRRVGQTLWRSSGRQVLLRLWPDASKGLVVFACGRWFTGCFSWWNPCVQGAGVQGARRQTSSVPCQGCSSTSSSDGRPRSSSSGGSASKPVQRRRRGCGHGFRWWRRQRWRQRRP